MAALFFLIKFFDAQFDGNKNNVLTFSARRIILRLNDVVRVFGSLLIQEF